MYTRKKITVRTLLCITIVFVRRILDHFRIIVIKTPGHRLSRKKDEFFILNLPQVPESFHRLIVHKVRTAPCLQLASFKST